MVRQPFVHHANQQNAFVGDVFFGGIQKPGTRVCGHQGGDALGSGARAQRALPDAGVLAQSDFIAVAPACPQRLRTRVVSPVCQIQHDLPAATAEGGEAGQGVDQLPGEAVYRLFYLRGLPPAILGLSLFDEFGARLLGRRRVVGRIGGPASECRLQDRGPLWTEDSRRSRYHVAIRGSGRFPGDPGLARPLVQLHILLRNGDVVAGGQVGDQGASETAVVVQFV